MSRFGANIRIWAIILLGFGILSVCAGITATVPKVPRAYVEAVGTATAIAPAIAPTVRYNEVVIPTIQAQEASEATLTVSKREGWKRVVDAFKSIAKIAAIITGIAIAVMTSAVSVAAGVAAAIAIVLWAWERYKRARAYEPYQQVPDRALFFPKWNVITDPRTGLTMHVPSEHDARIEHGHLLIERKLSEIKPSAVQTTANAISDVLNAVRVYRATWRNGERHPETIRYGSNQGEK